MYVFNLKCTFFPFQFHLAGSSAFKHSEGLILVQATGIAAFTCTHVYITCNMVDTSKKYACKILHKQLHAA